MTPSNHGQRFIPVTIRSQLLLVAGYAVCLIFGVLAVIAVNGLPFGWLKGEWHQRENEKADLLSTIADAQKHALSAWFEERLGDIRISSGNEHIYQYLQTITEISNQTPPYNTPVGKANFETRQKNAIDWLHFFKTTYKEYDLVEVVSLRDANILLSTNSSHIGIKFQFAEQLPANNSLPEEIRGFFGKDNTDSTTYLYLATPFRNGKNEPLKDPAVFVCRIDTNTIIKWLQSNTRQLGETGEIFMVDQNGILIIQLRHLTKGGTMAKPLIDRLPTKPVEYAAWGLDGTLLTEDYRGVPVMAVVRHIRILTDFGLGLIVKQDRKEIFAPIRQSMLMLGYVALAGMAIMILAISIVTRNFLLPLEKLTTAAQNLGHGDLSARAPTGKTDEIRVLANAFNTMADEIQSWSQKLESYIEERTRELAAANQHLKESETRLQAIFDNSLDAIGVSHMGTNVFVNPAYLRLFGYERQEEVVGRTILDLVAPESRAEVTNYIESRKRGQPAPWAYEISGLRKNGEIFELEVHVSQFELGGELFTLSIIRDITERKKAETDRKALQEQILHLQKLEAIGTLAGGIAHDFNNILAAILGYAELAQYDCPKGSQLSHAIEQIEKAGFRARDLVKQLLTFSRRQESKPQGPVALQTIVKESLKFLRATIPTTIEIRQNIALDSGMVLVGPVQIHQIFTNLCVNAVQAMEEKGGILEIKVCNVELSQEEAALQHGISAGVFVRLSVSDTGGGVAPAILKRIFDPYFTTKEVGKGSGMGLAIVHGIVQSYGGFIKTDNRPGDGVTFHVFLPQAKETAPQPVKEETEVSHSKKGEHILLVDDEQIITEMEKFQLERLGYRVTVARDGIEALKTFRAARESFHLVVTDQTMPGLTGMELARELLALRPELPIILCTGFSTRVDEHSAKSAGISVYAMKPLARGELAKLVRETLDGTAANIPTVDAVG